MKLEQLNSQSIYKGRAFNVCQDKVRLPDGRTVELDIVDHNDAVTIVPVDEEGAVWFIRQFRYPVAQIMLELPAGVMEVGEQPKKSAQRELREEIGLAATELKALGGCYLAPGYSTEYMHIFLATGLYPDPLPGDKDEFLSSEKIPLAQALNLAQTGKIKDAKSLVALFWAAQSLNFKFTDI
jgi:ADP-ribose pyrophosphatase